MDGERFEDFSVNWPQMPRHQQNGYFALADLKQRPPVGDSAVSAGWSELDAIWRLYPGQFTVVTGLAGSGKSTFLLNVVCNLAKQSGVRSFLYVPENEPHLRDKLRGIWGEGEGWEHFAAEQCFVQSAEPDSFERSVQDLRWVLTKAKVALDKDAVSVLLIDPWNELECAKHRTQTMTDYIRDCLMMLKQFCRSESCSVILVAHPTKAVTENGGRVPTLADIEHSMSWYNKCDNGLIVVRDNTASTCKIISAKVREEGSGKIGSCLFYVDAATGRFTPRYFGDTSYER